MSPRDPTTNCKGSSFKTPIQIPNSNIKKCSLLCSIEFIYPEIEWEMNAVKIKIKDKYLLRFYAKNGDTKRADVKYNGIKYQLEFIEFYIDGLHTTQSEGDIVSASPDRYDVEMVMYHQGFSSTSQKNVWLNLSVFITPMYTYSISQDFFYQLINPLCNKGSTGVCFLDSANHKSFINITSTNPTTTNSCTASTTSNVNNSRCIQLGVGQKWNPYQALPYKKSFYIYKGDFPYSPCLYGTQNDDIIWIVMENTVPMHYTEYDQLKSIVGTKTTPKFALNIGTNYNTQPIGDRPIYYNDGTYVQGNMDRDKFYVKCTKKEQGPAIKKLSFSPSNVDDVTDETGNKIDGPDYKTSSFVFYKPPSKYMSTIMLCFILSVLLFFLFYYFNGDNDKKIVSKSLFIFMAIATVTMFILSFIMVSLNILVSFLSILMYPWIIMAINALDNAYGVGEESGNKYLHFFIVGLKIFLLFYIFSALVIIPLTYYNQTMAVRNNYFYVENNQTNLNIDVEKTLTSDFTFGVVTIPDESLNYASFYIGINMDVEINCAGYQMFYRNDYILGQNTSNTEENAAATLLSKAYSPSDSVSTSAVIDKFHKIDTSNIEKLFSPDTTSSPLSGLKKNGIMLQILQKYNEIMYSNHSDPPQKFISAAWFVLKTSYQKHTKTMEDMIANIEIELQTTMCYLRQNKTCN